MDHFTKCLITNKEDLYPLKGYEKFSLVKSKSSGFVFISRIPSDKELIDHYKTYPRHDAISSLTIKRYEELLEKMEPYRKSNRILDVGCGNGHFLKIAKDKGWEVYGTEFTDEAIQYCSQKGINMNKGVLSPKNYKPESFDIITSFEVLEHINNPIEEIKNMSSLLRKNGLLYFTTPNFNAIERYILKDKYNVIEYPEHLSYYTPATINLLLTRNGFKKKKLETTGISVSRILNSRNTVSGKEKNQSNPDEKIRQSAESNVILRNLKNGINYFLSTFGIGNSLKGFYEKR